MVYPAMMPRLLKVGFHILLPFILFSFHVDHAMSTNDYINSHCSVTANYTNGSTFEVNMGSLFFTLTNDALPTGFSYATTGHGLDRVYGLDQWRGDVDEDTCNGCISNFTQQVVKYCPNTMDAIVWYEKCQFCYSNTNFFGLLNVDDSGNWHWINDKVEHPKAFNKKLGSLLKNLTDQATTEPNSIVSMFSMSMFDAGNIPYDDLQTIYGLVQCTRGTSLADCSLCLDTTMSQIPTTCGPAHGCEIATGNCCVRLWSSFTVPQQLQPHLFQSVNQIQDNDHQANLLIHYLQGQAHLLIHYLQAQAHLLHHLHRIKALHQAVHPTLRQATLSLSLSPRFI
uniref:Gnk2-homologous domain-containing protein n=1 Tax=Nymphaea colorata TaxID=210225 RepID=A0A5K0ZEP7_9MAGN